MPIMRMNEHRCDAHRAHDAIPSIHHLALAAVAAAPAAPAAGLPGFSLACPLSPRGAGTGCGDAMGCCGADFTFFVFFLLPTCCASLPPWCWESADAGGSGRFPIGYLDGWMDAGGVLPALAGVMLGRRAAGGRTTSSNGPSLSWFL